MDYDPKSSSLHRRDVLQLLGAGTALAGAGGCFKRGGEEMLPQADQPPEETPGEPTWYATSMVLDESDPLGISIVPSPKTISCFWLGSFQAR